MAGFVVRSTGEANSSALSGHSFYYISSLTEWSLPDGIPSFCLDFVLELSAVGVHTASIVDDSLEWVLRETLPKAMAERREVITMDCGDDE